jgi:hypothetical protein
MTIIACDGKSMAADGLCTGGGLIHDSEMEKVHRLNDGRLVGICGTAYGMQPFISWLNDESPDKPSLDSSFEALVLYPDGSCRSYNDSCQWIDQPTPCVTGSGSMVALGAMLAGADAITAVGICTKVCTGIGGKTTVWHLDGKEE